MKRKSPPSSHAGAGPGSYRRIYDVVARIPAGSVATYGQVAQLAGLPGHARQVGYALHALPDGTDVPWQRVLNARGEVSPRAGDLAGGREGFQRFLLEEEDVPFNAAGRVDLARFRWDPDSRPSTRTRSTRRRAPRAAAEPAPEALETRGNAASAEAHETREIDAIDAIEQIDETDETDETDEIDATDETEEIAALLRPLGSPTRAAGAKAYLKSDLEFFGVDTPTLRRTAKAWLQARPRLTGAALASLAGKLWLRRVHELRAFAIELLMPRQALLRSQDLPRLERMLRDARTWAYVDPLAIHVVGPLVARHPALVATLDRWSVDADFWLRRSALLAFLRPLARTAPSDPGARGAPGAATAPGAPDIWRHWIGYADAMLDEREFFVRKAIGWVLREVGKRQPRQVVAFLAPRLARIAGLTLREALKHLPAADRRRLQLRRRNLPTPRT